MLQSFALTIVEKSEASAAVHMVTKVLWMSKDIKHEWIFVESMATRSKSITKTCYHLRKTS